MSTNINRNANVVLITAHCSNREVQREGRQIAKLLQVSRRQSSQPLMEIQIQIHIQIKIQIQIQI